MGVRCVAILGVLALALAAPVVAQTEERVVKMVTPLTPKLRAIARTYYLNDPETIKDFPDREQRLAAIDTLEGAFADLDDDGQPEAFLRESGLINDCGTQGCWVMVLKKDRRSWHVLGAFMDKNNEFSVVPQKKGGFHLIKTYYDPHYDEAFVKWDGKQFISDDEANNFRDLSGR